MGMTIVLRLVTAQPGRMGTLHGLAHDAGLFLTETKMAVERLLVRGEVIRQGGESYRRPTEPR